MRIKLKPILAALFTIALSNPMVYAAPSNSGESSSSSNGQSQASSTSDDKIILNFENADIQTVIKAISKLSGKNFVIDPRVKGTVNIVSEKPISKSESYKVLESALRMQGFATVEADGVIKVLPETDAKTYGMKTDANGGGDQLITRVFTIDSGSATQISNAIRPMVSPNNSVSVYPNSNAIVVTDYASNMNRIAKVINELNATKASRVAPVTVKLKYAYASDVAQTLQGYLGNGSGGAAGGSSANNDNGPSAVITVDAPTNSIIITSNVQSKIDDLKRIALSLDTQNATNNNNLHVVYLKNADAAHVAEVLRAIASGQDNPDMLPSPAQRALTDTSSVFASSGGSGGSGGGGGMSGGGGSANNLKSSTPSAAGNDKNGPKVLIQAEPTTNSLIIQAPEQIYRNFRMIIDMLDVRRVQVMIETLIADVNTQEQGTFGIQWVGGAGNNNAGVGVVSNYGGNGSSISSIATTALGLAKGASGTGSPSGSTGIPNEVYVGLVTGTVQVGGQTIPAISTLADMITSNNAGNIIGRPTLLTLDNEEASIFVGANIGVPSGSYATTGGNSTVNPFTTVDRKDIGTVLRLKPLVTQSGTIQLSVYQEDSKLDPNQPTGVYSSNGPNILRRTLKTQILVNDGQIIALGGMTSDSITLQNSGIPVLSSIPYLGWLFSWQNRVHNKQNMVIFLRPVIIRNEEGAKALTNQRYRYIVDQENMVKADGNILLPKIDAVTLDNQVPFNNKVPDQPVTNSNEPIVDLTNVNKPTVTNGGTMPANNTSNAPSTSTTSNNYYNSNNQPASPYSSSQSNSSGLVVQQTAPNAISIVNNNPGQ